MASPAVGDRRSSTGSRKKEGVAKLHQQIRELREMVTMLEGEKGQLKAENQHLSDAMIRLSEASDRRDKRLKAQEDRIKQLEKIAHHDALTGLLDRSGMEIELSKAMKSIAREKKKGVVVYVDLDKFKLVNDICDHDTGDRVLADIGAILRNRLRRPTDLIARIGGDEFLLFLADVDVPVAQRIVTEMQELVRSIKVDHAGVVTLKKLAKRESVIDFSAGYALVSGDSVPSFSELMKIAEKDVPKFHARRSGVEHE